MFERTRRLVYRARIDIPHTGTEQNIKNTDNDECTLAGRRLDCGVDLQRLTTNTLEHTHAVNTNSSSSNSAFLESASEPLYHSIDCTVELLIGLRAYICVACLHSTEQQQHKI